MRHEICLQRLGIVATVASSWWLLSCPQSAIAAGDSQDQTSAMVGAFHIHVTPQSFSNGVGTSSFTAIRAASDDNLSGKIADTSAVNTPTPYVNGATYATLQTDRMGVKFNPEARVTVNVTDKTPTDVSWNAVPQIYAIDDKSANTAHSDQNER